MSDDALSDNESAQLHGSMADEQRGDSVSAAAEDWAKTHGKEDASPEEKVAGYLESIAGDTAPTGSSDLPGPT
ncbi:hypothetical protein [Nocardioides pacificus]